MLSKMNNKENKIKIATGYRFFLLLVVIFVFNGFLMRQVQAQLVDDFSPEVVSGLDNSAGLGDIEENINLADTDIRLFIARIINIVLGFLGIILLILIMYAGWLYMTSAGDAQKIELAKNIIKNAVIGLIIILSAFGISQFVFRALLNKGGDGSATSPPVPYEIGVGALGSGVIESHYPARNQLEVPRNTAIIITFKEKIDINSVCISNGNDCFLNTEAIKIYPLANENNLDDTDSYLATDQVKVTSTDNKTFIFNPVAYLGNGSTDVWYGVKLEEKLKKYGSDEIIDLGISSFYAWKFEVSNKLDLTPPQVVSVFPPDDDKQDTENTASNSVQAQWSVSVSGNLTSYKPASFTKIVPDDINITGKYQNCFGSGRVGFVVSISNNNLSVVLDGKTNVKGFNGSSLIINNQAQIGCGLTVDFADDPQNFSGQSINLRVQDEVLGDIINIQSNSYMLGKEIILTSNPVQDIVDALENDPWTTAKASGQGLVLTARESKLRGANSNQLIVTTTNNDALTIKQITTGRDEGAILKTADLPDQPRNVILQVNFNEAINPMYVNGYIAVKNGTNVVDGEFKISNNYKTIEFIPSQRCGQNSCGEDIFCLPASANIKVILRAADLYQCIEDTECLNEAGGFGEYDRCGAIGFCQKEDINYPQTDFDSSLGIMDLSNNSLDGNNNNNSESAPTDNYAWSFWTTSQSDLQGPIITQVIQKKPTADVSLVKQGAQATGADRELPINIEFDKLMMSSTIKPGQGGSDDFYPNSSRQREYLVQINYSDWPLGYWCGKEDIDNNNDGYADYTTAVTSHTRLKEGQGYGFLAGSGLRDIYQNCYNPASDNSTCGSLSIGQSCCLGEVKEAGEVCYEFE